MGLLLPYLITKHLQEGSSFLYLKALLEQHKDTNFPEKIISGNKILSSCRIIFRIPENIQANYHF